MSQFNQIFISPKSSPRPFSIVLAEMYTRRIGDLDHMPILMLSISRLEDMALRPDLVALVSRADGTRTVRQLVEGSLLESGEGYRVIGQLLRDGILE